MRRLIDSTALFVSLLFLVLLVALAGCTEREGRAPDVPPPPRRECVKYETQFVPEPRITSYDIYGIPLGSYIIMRPRQVCTEWREVNEEKSEQVHTD